MRLWKEMLEIAQGWSLEALIIRMFWAMLVGTLIGIDREMKNRSAGIKTHVLVCIGAALVMMTSQYIQVAFPGVKADLNRIGAQVISGVGFLGVGTIIVTGKNQVRGLTTAAGLWACACCGLAVGIGFIEGTVIALIFIMFTLKVLNLLDVRIHKNAKILDIYLEFENNKAVRQFTEDMHGLEVKISGFELAKSQIKGEGPSAIISLSVDDRKLRPVMLDTLRAMEYIRYAEEL